MLAGCAPSLPPIIRVALPQATEQMVRIATSEAPGGLFTRICRPAAVGPFRVVVINHGSPGFGIDRTQMQPASCDSEAAQWFVARGFMVVLPMRRGFGATGGAMAESSGPCESPDYVAAGMTSAEDIAAAVTFATSLPDAQATSAVAVGQSLGGWGVVAYGSMPHPAVTALINMAGGRGGWANGQPGANCRPDLLARAAGHFAAGAKTPMLWVYASNDSYFPPPVVAGMAQAYAAEGGQVELEQLPEFGRDGHFLFTGAGGSQVWGPLVERYLGKQDGKRQPAAVF